MSQDRACHRLNPTSRTTTNDTELGSKSPKQPFGPKWSGKIVFLQSDKGRGQEKVTGHTSTVLQGFGFVGVGASKSAT